MPFKSESTNWAKRMILGGIICGASMSVRNANADGGNQLDPFLVSGIRASQRTGTKIVDIYYNLSGPSAATVTVAISADGGTSYSIPASLLTGAVGPNVSPGSNLKIEWDAGAEWNSQFSESMRVRITAYDPSLPPLGFASIPGGTFAMGDAFLEGDTDELPVHSVTLSPFFIQQTEVTNNQVVAVFNWALSQSKVVVAGGVVSLSPPLSRQLLQLGTAQIAWSASNQQLELKTSRSNGYPCVGVTWYGAAAYCNYLSEMEGFDPCYTISTAGNWPCDFSKNGYRLPTEAEWEYAARGDLDGKRFPWGDTISHAQANYVASPGTRPYDVSLTSGPHPDYFDSDTDPTPNLAPATDLVTTGYGLHHIAGNAREIVNDFYRPDAYQSSSSINPTGPGSASGGGTAGYRVSRDGHWNASAGACRLSTRDNWAPQAQDSYTGFRPVRRNAVP